MKREIAPLSDTHALFSLVRVMLSSRPRVVNASTPKAGLLGMVAAKVTRVPTRVYLVRGARFESESGLRRSLMIMGERLAFACATDVLAVSQSLAVTLRTAGLTHRPIGVLANGSSNGVSIESLQRDVIKARESGARSRLLGPRANQYTVLFLGRFTRDKGVVELAEAMTFEGLKNATLLSAGALEEDLTTPAMHELSAEGRWVRAPNVSDIAPYLAAADVLCLPSHREGLANVLLEASVVGLPVVATNATGIVDAVIDGVTGILVPRNNPAKLAEALCYFRSAETRLRYGQRGRSFVEASFRQTEIWDALHELYLTSRGRQV